MALRNTTMEWGSLAKTLHWLIAIGLIVIVFLGLEQAGMERGDEKSRLRFIHASLATLLLILMIIRLVWRRMNDVPAHPEGMSGPQKLAATIVHWGLYVLVFAQLTGAAFMNGTAGRGLPVFGLFSIPVPIAESEEAHEWWEGFHEFMWKPLAALVVLHILGALYNHFVLKNDVVRRMTSGVK